MMFWVVGPESIQVLGFAPPSIQSFIKNQKSIGYIRQPDDIVRFVQNNRNIQVHDGECLETWDADIVSTSYSSVGLASALGIIFLTAASPANAVTTDVIPNALVAYSHYFFILLSMALLVYERFSIEAGMSAETEKSVVIADALYGINALLLFGSGYFRAIEYGKGWEFYSHEPIFWVKIAAASLLAGLSAFPTITLIKRGIPIFQGKDIEPMSESLAKRMQQVINAEISALLTIPLFATLMARGVSYNDEFQWPIGAAFVTLVFVGSGFLYAKQALTWQEEVPIKLLD